MSMIKKRGKNIIIRRGVIKTSFSDISLFDNMVYDEDITSIIIKYSVDIDDDLGPHFLEYPNLKEFEVSEKNSRFVSYDGILYMRLGEENSNSNIGT